MRRKRPRRKLVFVIATIIFTLNCSVVEIYNGVLAEDPTFNKTIQVTENFYVQEEPEPEIDILTVASEPILFEQEQMSMSKEDMELIALVTMAEAEGECEEGKRYVIDVILNRIDSERFPNSAYGVIYAQGQFTSMWNGRSDRCYVREDIYKLVEEELVSRANNDVLYFRTGHYHSFGTPIIQIENHYFSGI